MNPKQSLNVLVLLVAGGSVLRAPQAWTQNAGPADRNVVNTATRPGDRMADSPVTFPKEGPIPAKYPPDVRERSEPAEEGDYLFSSPCRSLAQNILPRQPNLVFIGGISQKDIASIRDVILQLRAGLPDVEILLATGTFGTTDPRDPAALAQAPHSGTGAYGQALKQLAAEERCAYLDMTTPWAEYIRSSKVHPHLFYRDVVHANEYGEQILARILMAFWTSAPPESNNALSTPKDTPVANPGRTPRQ